MSEVESQGPYIPDVFVRTYTTEEVLNDPSLIYYYDSAEAKARAASAGSILVEVGGFIAIRLYADGAIGVVGPDCYCDKPWDFIHQLLSPYALQIRIDQKQLGVPDKNLFQPYQEHLEGGTLPLDTRTALKEMDPVTISALFPESVKCHPPTTVCFWKDGTKTIAKTSEGTAYDPFTGMCVCIVKKIWGDVLPEDRSANGEINRFLKHARELRANPYLKMLLNSKTFMEPFVDEWLSNHPGIVRARGTGYARNKAEQEVRHGAAMKAAKREAMKMAEAEETAWSYTTGYAMARNANSTKAVDAISYLEDLTSVARSYAEAKLFKTLAGIIEKLIKSYSAENLTALGYDVKRLKKYVEDLKEERRG